MTNQLSRRGPDGEGYWVSKDSLFQFGHRRLKIIDLTDRGKQPMLSQDNRFVITFNGEIYNHKYLRKKINKDFKYNWASNSDTETILSSLQNYGFEKTIENLEGMFSFAVIDKFKNKLYLARDASGEKPLYYGYVNKQFIGIQLSHTEFLTISIFLR